MPVRLQYTCDLADVLIHVIRQHMCEYRVERHHVKGLVAIREPVVRRLYAAFRIIFLVIDVSDGEMYVSMRARDVLCAPLDSIGNNVEPLVTAILLQEMRHRDG